MADRYVNDGYYYRDGQNGPILATQAVLNLLNSIPEKDAEIASLKKRLDESEASHEDEETSHQETLKLWAKAKVENERLRKQVPDGMGQCTIFFKSCEKGHGRLTATNWVDDNGCQQCEIERLRAAVKPKASGQYIYASMSSGFNVYPPNSTIVEAWFRKEDDAKKYIADHQPKPVLRWVSRDKDESYLEIWLVKPSGDSSCYYPSDTKDQTRIETHDVLVTGIPAVPPGECHCYSVLDGVWTRVTEESTKG